MITYLWWNDKKKIESIYWKNSMFFLFVCKFSMRYHKWIVHILMLILKIVRPMSCFKISNALFVCRKFSTTCFFSLSYCHFKNFFYFCADFLINLSFCELRNYMIVIVDLHPCLINFWLTYHRGCFLEFLKS